MSEHISDIWRYVDSVVGGARPACEWEQKAVARFVGDHELQGSGWPWVFDESRAVRVMRFIELFPHVKGEWAKARGRQARIKLEPWQKFIVGNLFGWLNKETGLRRFNEAYISVPRKNAKSTLAAVLGHYMLTADGEAGAEVYCGATKLEQAKEVFSPARQMALRQGDFRRRYRVEVNVSSLMLKDGSKFVPVVGRPGDGASPSFAILDERHEHPDDVLYDTMSTGMGGRSQPLLLSITTAGSNLEGPCFVQERECKKMLQGRANDRLFAMIFTVDDEENWDTPEALAMANPNLGVSVSADYLQQQLAKAKENPVKAATYKTKHLNLWVGALNAWMNMAWWERQAGDFRREDFLGCRCAFALDLSAKYDITARVDIFERLESGLTHYYLFLTSYLPRTTLFDAENPNHSRYSGWVDAGYLTETDGSIIDYQQIEDDAVVFAQTYKPERGGFDPWGATQTAQRLASRSVEMVEIPQNTKQLSEPMKMLEALTKAGRLHHDNNPVMNWMMSNVVAKEDANENVFPRKENEHSKIDGVSAGIMALSLLWSGDGVSAKKQGYFESLSA